MSDAAARPADAGWPLEGRLVLLGVTGSIAAYKSADLVRRLRDAGADVQVLMSRTRDRVHRHRSRSRRSPAGR